MKNIFVGLIAICSSFVLANFGFGQAVSYTDISFNGYNGPEYEYDSGIVEGPTEHIAGVPGPSVLSGFASASFGTGYVKVSAQASDNTPIGYTASLTTTAVAFYVDTWTPVAGPYGTQITISAAWTLKGSVSSTLSLNGTGSVSPNGFPTYDEGTGNAVLSIAGTGLGNGPEVMWAQSEMAGNNIPGSASVDIQQDPNTVIPLTIVAFSGIPIQLDVQLEAQATGSVTSFNGNGGKASAVANFGHTLLWGGISGVTDFQGHPITDWSITSASGFNYANAAVDPDQVPEPSVLALLAIALPGLLLAGRRHSSR